MLRIINNRFINLIGQTKIKNEEINFLQNQTKPIFKMVNSKSLKKEIFSAYLESQKEIQILKKEIEILETAKSSQVLTIDDYGNDFVRRCEIHGKEINLFIEDLKTISEFLANNFRKVKSVELPSFVK